ncbi:MAG: hypothetical protein WC238_06195 [Parcubacteria group bacterium]|jgi:hypothetical protein
MKYITFPDDCKRIQDTCLRNNWDITLSEADIMWEWHSMGQSCAWAFLPPTEQEVWQIIEPLLERLLAGEDYQPEIGQSIVYPQIKQTTKKEEKMNFFEYKLKCNRCLTIQDGGITPLEGNEELFHSLLTNQPITTYCFKCKAEMPHKVISLSRNGENLVPEEPLPEELVDNRFKLTMDILNDPNNRGKVLAKGEIVNGSTGLLMTNSNLGMMLKWVLKMGGGYGDWAVYCHWATHSDQVILENGDKVTMRSNLIKIISFDDECWKKYRS